MKSFKQMISDKEIKRADMMKVQLEDLHEEPGFNLRDENGLDADGKTLQESIDELAEYIAAGGVYPPLEVRPRPAGGVWIVEGHRRRRALLKLDTEGRLPRTPNKDDPSKLEAWVPIIAFEGSDADRVARIISSQQNRKLTPLEVARGYKRLRAFGWDNEQIGRHFSKTPQHVAQLLTLADANSDVHKAVAAGDVSAAVAVGMVRKHGENAGQVLAQETEKAKAQGKKKVTAGTMKPKALPAKVADELEQSAHHLVPNMPTDTHAVMKRAKDEGAEAIAQTMVQVPAGFLFDLVAAYQGALDVRGKQANKARENAAKAAQTDVEDAA